MGWSYYVSIEFGCSHKELYFMLPLIYKNTDRLQELHFHELYKNGRFQGSRLSLSADQYKGDFFGVGFFKVLSEIAELFPESPVIVNEVYDQTRRTHFVIGGEDVLIIDEDDMGGGDIIFADKSKFYFCTDERDTVIYDQTTHTEIACLQNEPIELIKQGFLDEPDIEKWKALLHII